MTSVVSVVVPVYNRPRLLAQALDSFGQQTFSPFEVVVVDDGSTDETREVVKKRRDKSPYPLSLLEISPHTGKPSIARNRGVAVARGEFVAFCDSDDLWAPEKLSRQVNYLQRHSEVALVYTRELWERSGRLVSQPTSFSSVTPEDREGFFFASLQKCLIGPSSTVIRRDLFLEYGGFSERLTICEDYELWLRILAAHSVGFLPEPLTKKREGFGDHLSHRYGRIEYFRIRALKNLVSRGYFPQEKQHQMAEKVLAKKCRIYAQGCLTRGRVSEAEDFFSLAAQHDLLDEKS